MSLGLRTVAITVQPEAKPPVHTAARAGYLHDLTAPFGVVYDEAVGYPGRNISHTDLVDLLVAELPRNAPEPDLLILAHALPDLNQHRAVVSHLNHLTGGRALSFAVSGQGLGAPFTALRIAKAYHSSGRSHTPMIAVLDQTTLAYHDPVVHDGPPLADSGVLLGFGPDSEAWQVAAIAELGPAEKLAVRLPDLVPEAHSPLAVLGPWVEDGADLPVPVHRLGTGGYATSVWLALGREREAWAPRHDALLLCDTDPRTKSTHVAVLESPVGRARSRAVDPSPS